jgi:uncharacterized protein (DUF1778 family)
MKRRESKIKRKEESVRLRMTTEEKMVFREAAAKEGRDLSNWLRWLAHRAIACTRVE